MKPNRIVPFALFTLTILIVAGGIGGVGAHTAPPAPRRTNSSIAASITSQAPFKVSIQGRLTNPVGQPITSSVNITFRLYTDTVTITPVFSEGPVSVTPDGQGLLTYQLGSNTTIDPATLGQFANQLYLGLTVGNDGEMAPRILLTASPYALSLAPGALVKGSFSGTSERQGVINAINDNRTSYNNAGIFAEGGMGIWASAFTTGNTAGYGAYIQNFGGGTGQQYGISVSNNSTGGTDGIAGSFVNSAGGSGNQYGIKAQANSAGGNVGYGGYFNNDGGGGGPQYGIFASVTGTGSNGSLAGSFINNSTSGTGNRGIYVIAQAGNIAGVFDGYNTTDITVYSKGHVDAFQYDTHTAYDIVVKYNGSEPLPLGTVLALDGNNTAIEDVPTLGVVKATSANADAAIGVAQYPLKDGGKDDKGRSNWQIDDKARSVQPGDLVDAVVIGQVQMKVANARIGQRLTISSDGSAVVAAKGDDNIIGKVASLPDKNGFVTIFVNLK